MKIEISSQLQSAYDEQYTDDLLKWRDLGARYKAQNILDVCRSILPVQRVLDVGAGEGSILLHLDQQPFAAEFYAVEISRSGVEMIKRRGITKLKEVQHFNGYQLPYPNDHFDLVILSHVLEHVEYPRLLLRELSRVSRYQVIEVPLDFAFNIDERVEKLLAYGHINIYTPALLRFLLKAEGFRIVSGKTSLTSRDVMEYNWFINQKHPRTWRSRLRLNRYLWRKDLRRWLARHKDIMADAYTVLTEKSAESLKIF
ncbi:MAG: hypothetical protein OHK0046_23930 [Anaerolineae bacterium]